MPPTSHILNALIGDQIRRYDFRESGQILTCRTDYDVT